MAANAIGRSIANRLLAGGAPTPPTYHRRSSSSAAATPKGEGLFLPWLRSKAGTRISSVLSVGTSPLGRSLFASKRIREGDCIMEVPYSVQLTQDKLPERLRLLLDDVAGDTAKIAVLLMMEHHLGHKSGWAPYVRSLPRNDQMHNMMFWDLNELHMVRISSICDEAIERRERAMKEFSAVKPSLECFPHLFGEIKLEDFMHASALVSSRAWQTSRGVSLIFLTMMVFLILYYYMMDRKISLRSFLTEIMLLVNRSW
ncbi:ribosomal lysine N-methyltransferase 4 isoform X2 [Brachypodium distachyon]|uniref:ribosomal lysine N-methyltransferase 4 isoform X2 n=1 Tax=Brachypodium distachyon TaxID=15368 RepID=UPI00071D5640|nr:ribosomal lysine N-methyltransferase 4 isoform X2 [Brachypodium distachyon]|eukprot:XP_014754282.1 ribosomal lysine N-methyltransferase 4 isoform X2 [Brachypodium distachyon]